MSKPPPPPLPAWVSGQRQEAFARHYMMAEIYWYTQKLLGEEVQLLAHDIDVSGVDLTLIHDFSNVPLQLKSREFSSSTTSWQVRRRLAFPESFSPLHSVLFPEGQNPANEGLGGALVVQEIVLRRNTLEPQLYYRVGQLLLAYLRDEARFEELVDRCKDCPELLTLNSSDLTPPLTIAELLWLLLGLEARGEGTPVPSTVLAMNPDNPELAREALRALEARARARWEDIGKSMEGAPALSPPLKQPRRNRVQARQKRRRPAKRRAS